MRFKRTTKIKSTRHSCVTDIPVVACQCQSLPVSAGHSHSNVNKPRKACNGTGFEWIISVNTIKNTIIDNY